MASSMIGIEIRPDGLRLSQVRSGKITAAASARIPQGLVLDGLVTGPAAMGALIRDTLALRGIRGRACALVLPPQIVTAQHLRLPAMSRTELKLNLPFEFRDILPGALSDYEFDYITTSMDAGEMKLYAAAVPRGVVEDYRSLLKMAGLTLTLAVPAELAWLNLLRSRDDLPRKLCILEPGQSIYRLSIYSDGEFVTGKDIPLSSDEAIRRVLNLYNFSLPMGEAPLTDLIFCGDMPDGMDIAGMTVHPASRLLDGVPPQCALSAAAALQKEIPSRGASPHKAAMNLVRVRKEFDHKKMLPIVALLAGALLTFAYFGFLIPLNEKARAYNALSDRQEQLAQANARLLEWGEIRQDYLRYSDAQLTETEANLVSRTDILTLIESAVAPKAGIKDITVNNNVLTMNLSGITLEDAGSLVTELETWGSVQQAGILSATADDGQNARILISVTLASSGKGGEQND